MIMYGWRLLLRCGKHAVPVPGIAKMTHDMARQLLLNLLFTLGQAAANRGALLLWRLISFTGVVVLAVSCRHSKQRLTPV